MMHISRVDASRPSRNMVVVASAVVGVMLMTLVGTSATTGAAAVSGPPLVTKVAAIAPSCVASKPKLVIQTSTDLLIGFSKNRVDIPNWLPGERTAGKNYVILPALSRGAGSSWFLTVQVLDSNRVIYGPYRFSRPTSTKCLVRATQPSAMAANPKATVRLESSSSFGYSKSRTSAVNWVKREQPPGWFPVVFPAMQRGTTATWYIVVSPTDHSARELFLGPLSFRRG